MQAVWARTRRDWTACAPELQPPPLWIGKRGRAWPRPFSAAGLMAIPTLEPSPEKIARVIPPLQAIRETFIRELHCEMTGEGQ